MPLPIGQRIIGPDQRNPLGPKIEYEVTQACPMVAGFGPAEGEEAVYQYRVKMPDGRNTMIHERELVADQDGGPPKYEILD